ncbi:MAG: hypothetical protein OYK82_03810 [Gammaproteobacteria bacterium]|nr:hypothetical protein [Gammaproteobacteria bacterium]
MPFLDHLSETYFDGRLSPEVRGLMAPLADERDEVREFIERMCRTMRRQQIGAKDVSETLAWAIAYFLPKILPGAWGGSVPPITSEGRHRTIDDYLEYNPWRALGPGDRFLDLGCGFPPVTSRETAQRFPDVLVTAADPSFARYLVRHGNGDYACFGPDTELLYFQPGANAVERWEELYQDPEDTRTRFRGPLLAALEEGGGGGTGRARWEQGGFTVVEDPILDFSAGNLTFAQEGIGAEGLGSYEAVRCLNVLCYFDRAFRDRTLEWMADVLVEDGILVTGVNWAGSRHSRLTVLRREDGSMAAREFAFSIENVRPLEMAAWFALDDDDYELAALAELIGAVRSSGEFRRSFDSRMDELLTATGYTSRRTNGYLGFLDETAGSDPLQAAATVGRQLEEEGFAEGAAEILRAGGYDAWVNCVGHVAVDPDGLRALPAP